MEKPKFDLADRLLDFAAEVIKLTASLNKTFNGRHIAGQLMRSATSAGANWEETCGAESRQDFVHKMQIVLKELRESKYWLRLIKRANLLPGHQPEVDSLLQEAKELNNIVGKAVVTTKANT
jgi:four helix bundle protein